VSAEHHLEPATEPGAFDGVLETCLYHDTAQAAEVEHFYGSLLGLPLVARWPDGMAFRVGAGVLLLFDRELIAERAGPISAHGTRGSGHACLLAGGEQRYEGWRRRLEGEGIEITHEHSWDGERRSFYFADPAGNLLEVADGDLWPDQP
jgi:catechol 2,3-dioxygenase-like lactoylglutathione lyase family enzyme